ncbi:PREDICTED: inositol-tetrakisphosphate 1-kinase-like [Nanorana parkeri]|uniref:inositol-tetrakisphosphate 1-kinase-like n=1 Tax=Nanorana parkeri TaxID=125878 RepID=UPI000853F25B|nr:PREDICTED: inositol-tetrakisphosphate 1-kinase-like [Nanorana parkeri]
MPSLRTRKRIGVCLNETKKRKLNFHVFEDLCRNHGYDVTEVDLTKCLNSQGPFDLIIHKLSDLLVEAGQDLTSHHLVQRLQVYLDKHPFTILLDPLSALHTLLDRFQSYHLLRSLEYRSQGVSAIFSPPCVELMTKQSDVVELVRANLTFPIICKTRVAHGPRSHEMSLIFNERGLKEVTPPCLLQSFINHSATLYKVFVVGSQHFVVKRPSIRNFPLEETDQKTIFFNSHEVSKAESCSHLSQTPLYPDVQPPSDDVVRQVVQGLQEALGMSLFGIDLIVDTQTGRCAVIDVNAFPGYEGVPEFFSALLSHVEKRLGNNQDQSSTLELQASIPQCEEHSMERRSLPEPCKRQLSSPSYFSMYTPPLSADC